MKHWYQTENIQNNNYVWLDLKHLANKIKWKLKSWENNFKVILVILLFLSQSFLTAAYKSKISVFNKMEHFVRYRFYFLFLKIEINTNFKVKYKDFF